MPCRLIRLDMQIADMRDIFGLRGLRLDALIDCAFVKVQFFVKGFLRAHCKGGRSSFQSDSGKVLTPQTVAVTPVILRGTRRRAAHATPSDSAFGTPHTNPNAAAVAQAI